MQYNRYDRNVWDSRLQVLVFQKFTLYLFYYV